MHIVIWWGLSPKLLPFSDAIDKDHNHDRTTKNGQNDSEVARIEIMGFPGDKKLTCRLRTREWHKKMGRRFTFRCDILPHSATMSRHGITKNCWHEREASRAVALRAGREHRREAARYTGRSALR